MRASKLDRIKKVLIVNRASRPKILVLAKEPGGTKEEGSEVEAFYRLNFNLEKVPADLSCAWLRYRTWNLIPLTT